MANTIRIKRRASGASGAPTSLENAEIAFNEVDDILYYGEGTGGAGGTATTVLAIGGSGAFLTLSGDQTITGSKTVSGNTTFNGTTSVATPTANAHAATKLYVDNAISNVNANIANISTSFTIAGDTGTQTITTGVDTLTIAGGTGLTSVAANTDTITINLDNTAVSAATYGNASTVATFTVDAQGRLTAASNAAININAGQISGFTEDAQDAAAALFTNGTHNGIAATYDDANSKLNLDVADFTITLGGDLTGSVTVTDLANATLTATIAANSVALGTDTTGDYVAGITGTTNEISVSGSGGEGSSITIGLPANVTIANNLTVTGDLTVQGNTTTLNTATLVVEDKNIVLANVSSPTDITADGAGISVLGDTTKTFNWVDSTDAWTSSEHINLASSKVFKINGTTVLSGTNLDNVTVDGGTF
jgi:hypothetical protein